MTLYFFSSCQKSQDVETKLLFFQTNRKSRLLRLYPNSESKLFWQPCCAGGSRFIQANKIKQQSSNQPNLELRTKKTPRISRILDLNSQRAKPRTVFKSNNLEYPRSWISKEFIVLKTMPVSIEPMVHCINFLDVWCCAMQPGGVIIFKLVCMAKSRWTTPMLRQ